MSWVPQRGNAREMDGYDNRAIFLGVFDEKDRLSAFLRLIMPRTAFMLEKEFLNLRDNIYLSVRMIM